MERDKSYRNQVVKIKRQTRIWNLIVQLDDYACSQINRYSLKKFKSPFWSLIFCVFALKMLKHSSLLIRNFEQKDCSTNSPTITWTSVVNRRDWSVTFLSSFFRLFHFFLVRTFAIALRASSDWTTVFGWFDLCIFHDWIGHASNNVVGEVIAKSVSKDNHRRVGFAGCLEKFG